jgi:plastocyanin domain-containing protein
MQGSSGGRQGAYWLTGVATKQNKEDGTMIQKAIASMVLVAALGVTGASAEGNKKASARRLDISVTETGFEPDRVTVKKGEEVILAFTRKTDKTCAKEVIVYVNDKDKVKKELPLNKEIRVTAVFSKSGELRYECGMHMLGGVIVVQ